MGEKNNGAWSGLIWSSTSLVYLV